MKTYVVIGNSAAGLTAVTNLRQLDKESKIICISKEKGLPYNKCKLANYLAGKLQEGDIQTFFKQIVEDENIDLRVGERVSKVMSDNAFVLLENGENLAYDKLLIATGASSIKPQVEGANLDGVFTFHTLECANAILDFIAKNNPKKAVVVGGGMTGLECADALYSLGLQVAVIERNEHVLFRQSDLRGSSHIEQRMKQLGVQVYLEERAKAFEPDFESDNELVKRVVLESGKKIEADLIICAIGVRPNIRLAQEAQIKIEKCGIITNEYMQTSVPNIYAAGDVACVKDFVTGKLIRSCTWPDACMQANIAAQSMVFDAGISEVKSQPYNGAYSLIFSEFFGIKFASCGPVSGSDSSYTTFVKQQESFYNKILLKENIIKGFLLVGDVSKLGVLNRHLMSGQKIDLGKVYD